MVSIRYFISRKNSFKMFLRTNDAIDERNNLFSSNKLMRQSSKITKIDFLFLWTKYNKIWKFSRKKRKNKEGKKRKQTSRRYFIFPLNSHDWYETILVSSRHSCWWKHSAQDKCDALFHRASWQTIIFLSTAFSAWKKRKKGRKKERKGRKRVANRARKHAKQSEDRVSAVHNARRWPRVYSHERTGDTRNQYSSSILLFSY